jgi:predicted nucleic acid-binding protein
MAKPRIYLDTTIPSAYYTNRVDPRMVERRAITRRWWEVAARTSELLISDTVLRELSDGLSDQVVLRLRLVEDLEVLKSSDEIATTAAIYMRHKLMPQDPDGDALHLALASHHKCDALATWNYHHLANANKLDRIKRVNGALGLFVPRILTPLDLMEESA